MDRQFTTGEIKVVRELDDADLSAFQTYQATMPSYVDSSIEPVLATEGWLSRRSPDRVDDIIEPEGWAKGMGAFMQNPSFLLGHDPSPMPLGIWTELTIRAEGLYGKNIIIGTDLGKDVALLVNAGILRSYSAGFSAVDWEPIEGTNGIHFKEQNLIEGSLVYSPMHIDAIMVDAKSKGLELKYLNRTWGVPGGITPKGAIIVDQKLIDDAVAPVGKRVEEVDVKVNEVKGEFDKLAKMTKDLKDAAGTRRTDAETKALVDSVAESFKEATDKLSEEIGIIKRRKVVAVEGLRFDSKHLKSLVAREPGEIIASLPEADAVKVLNLQKLNDKVIMLDAMLEASSRGNAGNYHLHSRVDRIKGLETFAEFDAFSKAMDTATATEGAEWIPTELSGNVMTDVRQALVLSPLFTEIPLPTPTFEITTNGAETMATLAGETTAVVSAFNSVEQDMTTGKMAFATKKARGRYQISQELTEDSAVAIMPLAQQEIVLSIARAQDRAILNGDNSTGGTATFDSGYTVATTDFRHAWDGLRYAWYVTINSSSAGSVSGIDLGTFNETNLRKVRGEMGKHGQYPSDLALLMSITGYLLRMLNDLDSVQTLDKYGPNATVLKGELAKFDDIPNVVTEFMEETQNAAGIYDGVTTNLTSMMYVHRPSWLLGTRRGVTVEVVRDAMNDVWQIVAMKRMDFQPKFTPSSTVKSVNVGYNVATS